MNQKLVLVGLDLRDRSKCALNYSESLGFDSGLSIYYLRVYFYIEEMVLC